MLTLSAATGCGGGSGAPAGPADSGPPRRLDARPDFAGMGTGGDGAGQGGAGGGTVPGSGGAGGGGTAGAGTGGAAGANGGGAGVPVDGPAPMDGPAPPIDMTPIPPLDMAPVPTSCSVTPAADAASLKLAFRPIPLEGMPGTTGGKPEGITEMHFVPGSPNEILLAHVSGVLSWWRLEAGGNRASFLRSHQIPGGVYDESDCGLISVAFDPKWQTNRVLYAGYCTSAKSSRVSRYVVTETALTSPATLLSFDEPDGSEPWHSIGSMGFDPAGNMWLFHGDFTDDKNSQDPNSNLGKLLRFRPRPGGGVDPAPGNAWPGQPGKSPLVYAMGFRSPWRGYLDSQGRFLVGDVGGTTAEEVNLVTRAGENFGFDGTRAGPCGGGCPGFTDPLTTYRITSDPYLGQGNEVWEARMARAVWVGVQYQDCGQGTDRYGGALTGVYLFGDLYTGWVRGAVIDAAGKLKTDRLLANLPALTSFEQGPDGYLYAVGIGDYEENLRPGDAQGLYRVERAP